jgi:hypothetical protein
VACTTASGTAIVRPLAVVAHDHRSYHARPDDFLRGVLLTPAGAFVTRLYFVSFIPTPRAVLRHVISGAVFPGHQTSTPRTREHFERIFDRTRLSFLDFHGTHFGVPTQCKPPSAPYMHTGTN